MYEQIEKSKENKSRAVANPVAQKSGNERRNFRLTDKRGHQQLKVVQRQISDADYNQARNTLIAAGSNSARASHPKHNTRGGSPDNHGRQLVSEAIQEFRAADAGGNALTRGMTIAHFVAVSNAATEMNFNVDNIFTHMGI